MPAPPAKLICRQVWKSFSTRNGSFTALENISFTIQDREFVCIVGPSGCGKTTLIKIIAGLIKPSSGAVDFGNPLPGSPLTALVFQDHGLFPWMTVLDNVAFGLEARGVGKHERCERARSFVDKVGLTPFVESYPHELSIGMQQRVGIARAFLSDPQILLMDEPFSSLDAQTRRVLQEELLKLWRESAKSVLYITHDIEEAIVLGDRILVMTGRPGRIREQIAIPIERPRTMSLACQQKVGSIKQHIWEALEQEVRKTLGIVQ